MKLKSSCDGKMIGTVMIIGNLWSGADARNRGRVHQLKIRRLVEENKIDGCRSAIVTRRHVFISKTSWAGIAFAAATASAGATANDVTEPDISISRFVRIQMIGRF